MTTARNPPPSTWLSLSIILTSLLFFTARCSDAYSPPAVTSRHRHRWSSSLSSSTAAPSATTTHTAESSAASSDENITTRDILSLDYIRSTLIRQEETIIFALIERAQFRRNDIVYKVGGVPGLGVPPGSSTGAHGQEEEELSFLDFMFIGTVCRVARFLYFSGYDESSDQYLFNRNLIQEALHSIVRRYESPEEHAFFPSRLPKRSNSLSELDYPNLLSNDSAINKLNWNKVLYDKYLSVVVPAIADKGDDEQHGSTVLADIAALQALSKRIHFGKFVAESKYQSNPEGFQKLVDEGDADGVMALLTNEEVEKQVLTRARLKASTYGREPLMSSLPQVERGDGDQSTAVIAAAAAAAVVAAVEAMQTGGSAMKGKVDPSIIESIYRQLIIPMTKDVEVAYLFLRCGREPPADFSSDRMSVDVTHLSSGEIA
jgi:chorismate mutase